MEKYLYFGEATVETTGESCLFPISSFLGMTPSGANGTTMHFKSRNGAATDDAIVMEHGSHTPKQFMTEMVGYMQKNHKNPFLIVSDGVSGARLLQYALVSTVGVTTAA
jgi:hypothetical protein|tara:strand:+ start:337 stop:663 length:327 start_codon:yes stop_codon:yes gene_type:complete